MLPFKYSQLPDKFVDYDEIIETLKSLGIRNPDNTKLHLGQFKLFFSELLFLTKHAEKNNKVLYVGAATGYHIAKLADMFKDLNFELWDPGNFDVPERKNIKIFNQFFDNHTAQLYSAEGNNILFICDIRTITIGQVKRSKLEDRIDRLDAIVTEDMDAQMKWTQIINPKYAYLKFRLPYNINYYDYLNGTIYLQPYSPLSIETRLMTNDYYRFHRYDCFKFADRMAYFNYFIRTANIHYIRWKNIMNKYNLNDNWDNAYALHLVDYYLRKIKDINSDDEVGKLFMNIWKYHYDRYGDKYNVIFKK